MATLHFFSATSLWLLLVFWSGFGLSQNDTENHLYYIIDTLTPEQFGRVGWVYPPGYWPERSAESPSQPPIEYSLYRHAYRSGNYNPSADPYISVFRTFDAALMRSQLQASTWMYIYQVHSTPNLIDVAASLGQYSVPDEVMAAYGPISFHQVTGCWRLSATPRRFVRYEGYDGNLYDSLRDSGARYQLAGFPNGHPALRQAPWIDLTNCGVQELQKRLVARWKACEDSQAAELEQSALEFRQSLPCYAVDRLIVKLKMDKSFWAGTWDLVSLALGKSTSRTILKSAPSRGDTISAKVNIREGFGKEAIALADVNFIVLIDTPNPGNVEWQTRDAWMV